jgi:hypothetical protein
VRYLVVLVAAVTISACGTTSPTGPDAIESLIVVGTPPAIGRTSQFTALAVHNDGATAPVTSHVTWLSSNPAVAVVKDDGTVTGVSLGSVEISATASGTRGALTFDVTSGPAYRLSGTVFDGSSFRRLPAVAVVAKDASGASISVVTDVNGNFSIAGIAGGPADVTANADGYIPNTISTQILGDTNLTFTLGRFTACPVLGFDDLATLRNGTPFSSWSACGFTVTATSSIWTVSTSVGRPAPDVQFSAPIGATASAELVVTATGAAKFRFQSVDLSSGTSTGVYSITGIANGAAAFVLPNSVGSTFGGFITVRSVETADTPIDVLLIRLNNSGATCCGTVNAIGVDNIVLAR